MSYVFRDVWEDEALIDPSKPGYVVVEHHVTDRRGRPMVVRVVEAVEPIELLVIHGLEVELDEADKAVRGSGARERVAGIDFEPEL